MKASFYRCLLKFEDATFSLIAHEDAIVADVYKITRATREQFVLKGCARKQDYLRKVYFLHYFAGKLLVPKIIRTIEPEPDVYGAILMEHLTGEVVKKSEVTGELANEIGASLSRIHLNRTSGYGDLIEPNQLSSGPRLHFTSKFEEGPGRIAVLPCMQPIWLF